MINDLVRSTLPAPLYQKLKRFYKENITEYKRDIYSEFGEDFIAAVLLSFKRNGFYVDIGAFRPKELSTTYYFYRKLNWSGIIIEPNPAAKEEFLSQRPKDTFLNMGAANTTDKLTYYKFQDPTLNSFNQQVYDDNRDTYIDKLEIPVAPLADILDKNLKENQTIDLMNIDVEGLDLEVLRSNNWDKYSPRVILIEDLAFQPEKPLESPIVSFLKEKGYSLKANCLISLIFLKD